MSTQVSGSPFFDGYLNARRKEKLWEGVHVHRVFTMARGRSAL